MGVALLTMDQSPQLGIIDRDIARIKDRIASATAMRVALSSILMDKNLSAQTLLFMRYQMVWLLRLVDPTHQYPKKVLRYASRYPPSVPSCSIFDRILVSPSPSPQSHDSPTSPNT